MKKNLLHIVLIFITIIAYAQSDYKPGYVITLDGDTLHGYIDYRGDDFNSGKCSFKTSPDDMKTVYVPGEISSYGITEGRRYVSKRILINDKEQNIFLEQLVDGKADLYALPPGIVSGREDMYASQTRVFFIETEERGLQKLENTERIQNGIERNTSSGGQTTSSSKQFVKLGNEYIAYLKIYFQDQFEIMDDVERTAFKQNDLIDITTKYHDLMCPDEECIVYSKEGPKVRNRIAFMAGSHINTVQLGQFNLFGEEETILKNTSFGFMAGIQLENYTAGQYDRFFSRLSVFYSKVEHKSEEPYPIYLKYQAVQASLTLNYIYPRYKLKPSIGLGARYLQTLKNEEGYVRFSSRVYNPARKSFGPAANLALLYEINEKLGFKIQAEYFYDAFNNPQDPYFTCRTNCLDITVGLTVELTKKGSLP